MILVDTSAWVEFDRATGSEADKRLVELLRNDADLAVTEPVVMEVTAGARDAVREQDLRRLLGRCTLLRFDASVDFDAASRIYRMCRRTGITPRGMIDCMIVSVAHRHDVTLLATDNDLRRIAGVVGVGFDNTGPGIGI